MRGTISCWFDHKQYGWISVTDPNWRTGDIWFHQDCCLFDPKFLRAGVEVEFRWLRYKQKNGRAVQKAVKVQLVEVREPFSSECQ